ncbi:MAG: glycosyltransferase [Acidobacteriota bacterium]|nr:glycosyltransferase [Acidobacteriota bacterium]
MTDLLATVVLAVHKDARARRTVEALRTQTVPAHQYEVVIVENGTADLADLAEDPQVRHVFLPTANSARARNAGLRTARGTYLLLTDADCVPAPDWIERLTACLAESGAAAAGGAIDKAPPRTWAQRHAITVVDGQRKLSYLPAMPLPYVAGANAGFVTALLRAAGGFDEDLKSGNDVDACYRVGLNGGLVVVAPAAVVSHEDRASVAAHFHRFRHYAVYQVLLYAKYKHLSGRRAVFDGYPFRRAAQALAGIPAAAAALARADPGPASRSTLQLLEAAGVLCGTIQGAATFRQPYL